MYMWQNCLIADSHGLIRVSELNQYRSKRAIKYHDRNPHTTDKIYEIKLSNGLKLKLTPENHIGVITSQGNFVARKVTDVEAGDIVLHYHGYVSDNQYPLYFSDVYKNITPEIAYIIGLMLRGTASYVSSYNLIKLFTNGTDYRIITNKIEDILGYDIGEKIPRSKYVEIIPSENFSEFIRCCHILSVNERDGIPLCIRRGSTDAMNEFLAGYLYVNGYEISTDSFSMFGNHNIPVAMCKDILVCSLMSPLWMESVEINKEPYYKKDRANILGKYAFSNETLNSFYGPKYKDEDETILESIDPYHMLKGGARLSTILAIKELEIPLTKFEKIHENYKHPVIMDSIYVDAIYKGTKVNKSKKGKK